MVSTLAETCGTANSEVKSSTVKAILRVYCKVAIVAGSNFIPDKV